ncbi:uncharacterized protein MONBRDRAFT_8609 [Monosiga brevicollis MX1]|uniref:Uncharacterized protein n=1 Tax=Monosiga brevicollis TaxID=81824 RepID=A9V0K1_MONBE|nr:uncharacterized protein MONBRDRAFT_8609 [Monosiga brevicollis MX1]EDQ89166.1 predicted protein [Monosiga brevicollis MX1]|eukprot:XP_001746271.1 hypothetical protein [Monosiga brevicollis MX1]
MAAHQRDFAKLHSPRARTNTAEKHTVAALSEISESQLVSGRAAGRNATAKRMFTNFMPEGKHHERRQGVSQASKQKTKARGLRIANAGIPDQLLRMSSRRIQDYFARLCQAVFTRKM